MGFSLFLDEVSWDLTGILFFVGSITLRFNLILVTLTNVFMTCVLKPRTLLERDQKYEEHPCRLCAPLDNYPNRNPYLYSRVPVNLQIYVKVIFGCFLRTRHPHLLFIMFNEVRDLSFLFVWQMRISCLSWESSDVLCWIWLEVCNLDPSVWTLCL